MWVAHCVIKPNEGNMLSFCSHSSHSFNSSNLLLLSLLWWLGQATWVLLQKMCKSLLTLQESRVEVSRVRVRVRILWPSTNPDLSKRVRGFSEVFISLILNYSRYCMPIKLSLNNVEKIILRGLTTFAMLSIVQNVLDPLYFINNLLKTICTIISMLE